MRRRGSSAPAGAENGVHFPPAESGQKGRRGPLYQRRNAPRSPPFADSEDGFCYTPAPRLPRGFALLLRGDGRRRMREPSPAGGSLGGSQALPAGLARQNRQKLTKRGALCYDGDRRCQIRQAVSTSRKGGDAHGYIRRADPDRYFDREHLQSGLSDLQKEMTAPGQGVRSNPLIQT